jgi:hypothetical protein
MRNDGSSFRDYEIHKYLRNKGTKKTDGEWFTCSVKDVQAAIIAIKKGELNEENRASGRCGKNSLFIFIPTIQLFLF